MTNKFEKDVDKFDSGEFIDMKSDREIIGQIAQSAEVLGERKLRKELKGISKEYHGRKRRTFWMLSVAASLTVVVLFYFQFSSGGGSTLQEMQIETAPTLLDSATYRMDTTEHIIEIDSAKH